MRTHLVVMIVAGLAVRASSDAAAQPAPKDEERLALSASFAEALGKAVGITASGNTLKPAGHTLALTATIEQVENAPNNAGVLAGVRVTCDVDGKRVEALTSGSVGVDSTREAALQTAAEEWAMQYGAPVVDALSAKATTLQAGGFKIHAGATGIRGDKPDKLAGVHDAFFRALGADLATLVPSKAGLHAITITLVHKADGAVDGQFRVDGETSAPLRQRALKLTWPASQKTYMFKQYYVLVGGKAG